VNKYVYFNFTNFVQREITLESNKKFDIWKQVERKRPQTTQLGLNSRESRTRTRSRCWCVDIWDGILCHLNSNFSCFVSLVSNTEATQSKDENGADD